MYVFPWLPFLFSSTFPVNSSMADWSLLPNDLLDLTAKRLESCFDLLRFRSVCSSWRSSVLPISRRLPGRFPILPNDGIFEKSYGFYLSRRTIFLIGLPESRNQTNPVGWVVKIEEDAPERKHLLNPLSRYRFEPLPINFPRILDLSNFRVCELGQEYVLHYINYRASSSGDAGNLYMEKVVLMCSNSERDFVLLTIHVSGKLAVFKSGDKRWTIIQDMPSPYDDVILFKGKFYAVDNTGRTVLVELSLDMSLVAQPVFGGDKKYLVESSGELLLVDMYLSMDVTGDSVSGEEYLEQLAYCMSERTVRFKVFKLDEEGQKWVEVKSLGDRVLFLGDDCTFSASASDLSVCRGNCIFFADNFFFSNGNCSSEEDDGMLEGRDIGIFNLENGSIGRIGNYHEYSKLFWPPPHWVSSTILEVQNHVEELTL